MLRKKFRFRGICEPEDVPRGVGKTAQWYRPTKLTANTNPSAEGVIGSPLNVNTSTVTATVQEYSDFVSGSTLLMETDISAPETRDAKELGYRAGLSVDTICRAQFDSGTTAVATLGATATIQDVRAQIASLEASDVLPRDGDNFVVVAHPYTLYDIKADNTAGGFLDVAKYAAPTMLLSGEVGRMAGAIFVSSTNVGTSGAAPNVLYSMYVAGKGGVGAVSLSGRGPSNVVDPINQNFNVAVVRGGKPSIYDPEGKIGYVASYRFVFTTVVLDSTDVRYRIVSADASLV